MSDYFAKGLNLAKERFLQMSTPFIGILLSLLVGCNENKSNTSTLFELLAPSETGITFNNQLYEDNEFNIIQYLYFYNGGGIAIGDINNDGLSDIYFSANQLPNRLYLNKGDFKFEDITERAGVAGSGNWKTGVTMADVNGDGLLDIYVCHVDKYKQFHGHNELFINKGNLTFAERSTEYGVDFSGFSTQTAFADFDNDGDLDMFLLNHSVHSEKTYGRASARYEKDDQSGGRLFRNELDKDRALFTDITDEAGILSSKIGYGLGVSVSDINMDGWPDIYVSNDFRENDYLYLNQKDGTFKQVLEKSLDHSSRFSMGNDVADFNNDLLPDIFTTDMLPQDEAVIKSSVGEDSYEIYKFKLSYGYYYQVARNALQLNAGNGRFHDIALAAGVAATDWSWAPLLADFDNDGFKDLFVSNGILKRPNDLTYLNFISSDSIRGMPDSELVKRMPSGKVSNYIFKNNDDFKFSDNTIEWGLKKPSCSNGSAYSDLDNDGDLDLIVNNINEKAFVYRNTLSDSSHHYIKIKLKGSFYNKFATGAKIFTFSGEKKTYHEVSPTRGWLSSVDPLLTIGVGESIVIDSTWIVWPNSKIQKVNNLRSDQLITFRQSNANESFDYKLLDHSFALFLTERLPSVIDFKHHENDVNEFNQESLIPHMQSTTGPKMSVGDVNNDNLTDVFIGGASGQSSALYIQKKSGDFRKTVQHAFDLDSLAEDTNSAFFDADNDGDLDLIVVSGGQDFRQSANRKPRLYLNNGRGEFIKSVSLIPDISLNASCVRPADFDGDGDQDLFIGSDIIPLHYGINPTSYFLINEGDANFSIAFTIDLGLIHDAAWIDLNNDKRLDIILVGEWMPITILIQDTSGQFNDKTNEFGLSKTAGWWNCISVADFDKDGDLDLVAGNLGINSRLKATEDEPVEMYISDFDLNGSTEQILTYYNKGKKYPFASRDQLVKQIPILKKKFLKYENYKNANLKDVLSEEQLKTAVHKQAFQFHSVYFSNEGNKFRIIPLPLEAQFFPVQTLLYDDVNHDGNLDLLLAGNLYATQPDFGRYDAGEGLVLIGDGKGGFKSVKSSLSGFNVLGEGRDIKSITVAGKKIYLVSKNNDKVQSFEINEK